MQLYIKKLSYTLIFKIIKYIFEKHLYSRLGKGLKVSTIMPLMGGQTDVIF